MNCLVMVNDIKNRGDVAGGISIVLLSTHQDSPGNMKHLYHDVMAV